MKKIFTLLVGIVFWVNGFSQVTFVKRYGGWYEGTAYSVKQTSDGGYIILSYTELFGAGQDDIFLIKTDYKGDTLWTKTFGGDGWERGYSVQQTADGGYFITGLTSSFGAVSIDIYIIKTDGNGTLVWSKTFNGTSLNYTTASGRQTNDGGYIIVGNTDNFGTGGYDVYLIRIDASGNLLWAKTYGGPSEEAGECVEETSDHGFIITGYSSSYGAGDIDIYLLRTDSSGNFIFSKTCGGTGTDFGKSVVQTTDGGYIICGYTNSFGAGSEDICLIKTDNNGDVIWTKTYGTAGADQGYSVIQNNNGGYVVTGLTYGVATTGTDLYLVNVNDTGAILWNRTYSFGNSTDAGYCVQQTNDGGYIVSGTGLLSPFVSALILIKTDSIGRSGCAEVIYVNTVNTHIIQSVNHVPAISSGSGGTTPTTITGGGGGAVFTYCTSVGVNEINAEENTISLFPNPATNEIEIKESGIRIDAVEIYDVLGRRCLTPALSKGEGVRVDVSSLSAGIYFVKVRSEKAERVMKFVKE